MTTAPSIILTRLDVQRLESFIGSQDENTPGLQALQA
ncbi:nucleoside diphosphate kinase regulator, partial [Pseudomonas syringae pv. actinidiae]|nr:nucleoside diphosphate kinase regulator [Pseudomonas syringae pv. actinidiae]